jgi:diguanylate cyclase (GGDEF)-like protein
MNLSRSVKGSFSRSELRLIGLLAEQAAIAISNASMYKLVTDLANTDSVTGLPNRHALDERLQEDIRHAKRMSTQFAVVMMDLDGFKNVNDTYGHAVGDETLNSLFNYLAENIRPTDFLARYGGDELTLIARDTSLSVAEIVTKKFINLVKGYKPPISGDHNIEMGISCGIAVYPIHARTAGDLLRAADAALYQAKKHNRGFYTIAKGVTGPLEPITGPRPKRKPP